MAHIRFSIQVDTEDEEPSRVVRRTEGTLYEYEGESDNRDTWKKSATTQPFEAGLPFLLGISLMGIPAGRSDCSTFAKGGERHVGATRNRHDLTDISAKQAGDGAIKKDRALLAYFLGFYFSAASR
jgi:hypothetical protein